VLSLKGNQGSIDEDVDTYFTSSLSPTPVLQTVDGVHGRIETRMLRVSDEIAWLTARHAYSGLQSIITVTVIREIGDKITEETHYYLSSLNPSNPDKLAWAVRAYWAIENNLHWVLDVAF